MDGKLNWLGEPTHELHGVWMGSEKQALGNECFKSIYDG
jgi:hypothetical protein